MSTRSHIIVREANNEHYVYHHSDGYLEGVGAELKEFIKTEYKPIDFSSQEFCEQLENWDSSYEFEDYGIHGDEEYLYTVVINKEVPSVILSAQEAHWEKIDGEWETSWTDIDSFTETFKI